MDVSQEAMEFIQDHIGQEYKRVTSSNFDVVVELKNAGIVKIHQYDGRTLVTMIDERRAQKATVGTGPLPMPPQGGGMISVPIADDYAGIRAAAEALKGQRW